MSIQEHVILVNDQGKVIGTQEKYAAHTSHTPLHLALSKKAWPGVWTNSVCGHPQADEATEQAIIRRCRFEVGAEITDITPITPEFRYREADPSGIVENEICPVYAARVTNTLAINDEEVMEYQWVELDALFRALDATPWAFSPWMVQEANTAREKLSAFAAQ